MFREDTEKEREGVRMDGGGWMEPEGEAEGSE